MAVRLGYAPDRELGGTGPASARLLQLHHHILSFPTATTALQRWCEKHKIGSGSIEAIVRTRTGTLRPRHIGYRDVLLVRGRVVLCEAEIWFRMAALTSQMRDELEHTTKPFGAVIGPLGPQRINTRCEVVRGSTQTPFGDRSGTADMKQDDVVLRHSATVVASDGRPIARTRERFLASLLNFEQDGRDASAGTPAPTAC